MKIGIPKEIKTNENRVSLVPAGAEALVAAGHEVIVETGAGIGSSFIDEQYLAVGGADRRRVAADGEGADHLHVFPFCGR
jgi:alanine dehydrogenase